MTNAAFASTVSIGIDLGEIPYYHAQARKMLALARAYRHSNPHMRRVYLERVADYRETIINIERRAAGWTLAERIAGRRA